MMATEEDSRDRLRREQAKLAINHAMRSRWEAALQANLAIINEFPDDLEAFNRLGKALSELGRLKDAVAAFQRALEISPYNSIAKKNLERLSRLGKDASGPKAEGARSPQTFIEDSGKSGKTSLINLAAPEDLLKLAPGRPVKFDVSGNGLKVIAPNGGQVGQVEPRLASRLTRLMSGGNRYEATVTSVGERELSIIIREVYQDPSHAGIVSFPSRAGTDYRVYLPSTIRGQELAEEDADGSEPVAVKDWTDDDTEPGDDDAFSPVLHRIISAGDQGGEEEEF